MKKLSTNIAARLLSDLYPHCDNQLEACRAYQAYLTKYILLKEKAGIPAPDDRELLDFVAQVEYDLLNSSGNLPLSSTPDKFEDEGLLK